MGIRYSISQDIRHGESDEALDKYAATLRPSVYDDFIEEAKTVLDVPRKEKPRHLLEFRFRRHSRYNLPAKRLTMIEKQVRKRAAMLLE